jgi:hypothetical protein
MNFIRVREQGDDGTQSIVYIRVSAQRMWMSA